MDMIQAIVYRSGTGYTKKYANLLAEMTGLPAYDLAGGEPPEQGAEVIYLGWIMAERVMGLEDARKRFGTPCVCAVGMGPGSAALVIRIRRKNKILGEDKAFYLQGGFDLQRLKGPFRLIMAVKVREIAARLEKKPKRTAEEEATLMMTKGPYSCVCPENLRDVMEWYRKQG